MSELAEGQKVDDFIGKKDSILENVTYTVEVFIKKALQIQSV